MKKIALFAIILLLILPMTKSTGQTFSEEEILLNILEDLGAEFLEGDISLGGKINDNFSDQEAMVPIVEEMIADLGIMGSEVDSNRDITNLKGKYYVRESLEEENFSQVSIYGYDRFKSPISIVITSYFMEETGESETNIFINLRKQEKNLNISGIIDNVYEKYSMPIDNTNCIIGTASGKLDSDILKENIQNILGKYNARIIEEYEDKEVISYTVYTPYIKNHMFSYEKRVNLNLAIRYNEYENKTYFWIATPIITTGY